MHLKLAAWVEVCVLLCSFGAFAQVPPANVPPPDGAAIFQQHCAKCHGDRGQGVNAVVTFAGPCIQAEHNPGKVMMAMEVGPSHMPSFARVLSIPEMHAVSRYVTEQLAVIPLVQGDVGKGGELFRIYCASCHRTAVRGGALAFTDVNAPALTHKSKTLIAGAIRSGPGPMPAFPKSVLDDQQLASVVEYVRTVQHPPTPGGNPLHFFGPVPEGFVACVSALLLILVTGWIEKGRKG